MKEIISITIALFAFCEMALPCEGPPIQPSSIFSIDTTLNDEEPPGEVTVVDWRVVREDGDGKYESNSCGATGCAPEASIGFKVIISDEQNGDQIGYIVELIEPETGYCYRCGKPIMEENGWIWVSTFYSAGNNISRIFNIKAVDRAGNEGNAARIDVFDPDSKGGCTSGPVGNLSDIGFVVLAMLFCKIAIRLKV